MTEPALDYFLADKPGAAQSVIRAGHLTIPRHDPDYHAMNLLNYVFGGNPMARLFMNLRQDKGYSYGYSSSIEYADTPIARSLKGVAQVMCAGLGTRIYYAQHGSFDTHSAEVLVHSRLWQELSAALSDFTADGAGISFCVVPYQMHSERPYAL